MKSLRESLLDNDLVDKTDEIIIKNEIEEFLKANYNCRGSIKISEKPNKDDLYEVSSNSAVEVTNKNIISLTNGMFIWTIVDGSFFCNNCKFLKSLEGAPKKVGGGLYCYKCDSLTSLNGAPEKVELSFSCNECNSLTSLNGSPKEVGGRFYCNNCAGKFTIEDVKKVSNVKGEIKC